MQASIIIPTCRPGETLGACYDSISRLQFDFQQLEVVVVTNGNCPRADFAPRGYPFRLVTDHVARANISAAKNRAVDLASGELLLFINDDTMVEPDFVSYHLAAHASLAEPAMVLGHSEWRRHADETVFERLIAETSLVFFYHRMQPRRWYGFRHAWNLNLSVPRALAFAERFDERFHYTFEDMEWAYRLEVNHGCRVWYEPAARSLHDHRYTIEAYLRRERQHGQVARLLWDVNSDCFTAVYGEKLGRALIDYYRRFVSIEGKCESELQERFRAVASRPAASLLSDGRVACDLIPALYYAFLPLKRLTFRRGFLDALCSGRKPDSFAAISTPTAGAWS